MKVVPNIKPSTLARTVAETLRPWAGPTNPIAIVKKLKLPVNQKRA
jgi:hypothetical protein